MTRKLTKAMDKAVTLKIEGDTVPVDAGSENG